MMLPACASSWKSTGGPDHLSGLRDGTGPNSTSCALASRSLPRRRLWRPPTGDGDGNGRTRRTWSDRLLTPVSSLPENGGKFSEAVKVADCASGTRDLHRPLGFDTALSTNKHKYSVFVAIAKDYRTCARDCHRVAAYRTSRTDVRRGSHRTLHQSHGALVKLSGQQRKSKPGGLRQICRLTVNCDAGSPPAAGVFEVGRL